MTIIATCPKCDHEFKVRERNAVKENVEEAYRLYSKELLSLDEVGKKFNVSGVRVAQVFKELELPIRSRREMGVHRLKTKDDPYESTSKPI